MDQIHKRLMEVGIPCGLVGFIYAHDALEMLGGQESLIFSMGKLCELVAEKNNTTPSRVERAIRHAIEVAFDRMPVETQEKFFWVSVSPIKGKLTNKEFLSAVALSLKG